MLSRLRENRVVPAALLVLAVGVVAWLLIPVVWGGGDSAGEPVSSQPEVAQTPDEPEDPAPAVENRNVASYSAFQSKDPFEDVVALAEEEAEPDEPSEGESAEVRPGDDPEADAREQTTRQGRAQDGPPDDREGRPGADDDFSVLEAAEGERGAPRGGDPGTGGVGGDGPGGRQEAFQNGGGPRGPSK